ncbi:MAG: hypothetical protein M0Z80_00130 [Treponema sp.]|nr:hypothetical protein [Treponema sp.]
MNANPACIVLSGKAGSGKTSSLRAFAAAAAEAGHPLAVALQLGEARGADGRAHGFSMELLRAVGGSLASERRALARERAAGEASAAGAILHGHYVFEAAVFSWAEAFVRGELGAPRRPVLVGLDEMGKLELSRGEGLGACLDASLDAMSGDGAPRLLVLTARGLNLPEILKLVGERGLAVAVFEAGDREGFFRAGLAALSLR